MLKRVVFCFVALAMSFGASAGAWAKDRYALVIGNSKYQATTALPNPVRDAAAVAELLDTAGFEVTSALDLGQSGMRRAVRDFAAKLAGKGQDTAALVYFAGHGVQIDGENYLLPVDARLARESDVALEAVRLADVMNALETVPSKTRIVILDACRNNPFGGVDGDSGRGLVRVKAEAEAGKAVAGGFAIVNAPAGTVVAYSTSPGATAEDGTGANSPFTAALVEAARTPGAAIETVFRNVRLAVHRATEGRQTPWEVTALTEPFSFFPGKSGIASRPVPGKSQAAWRRELRSYSPRRAYELVVVQNDVTVYRIFLAVFPDTPWSFRIRGIMQRRLEMLAWFDAVTLNSAAAFEAFLARYPDSALAAAAQRLQRRARLRSAVARTSPGALPIASNPEVRTVIKEVRVPSPPQVRTVIKTVIREVRVPVVKEVIREVRVPVVKIREVRVPVVRIKEVRVPVVRIRTVVKRVPVRVPCKCGGSSRPRRGGHTRPINSRLPQPRRFGLR